jgi:glutamyl-tRNA reductase
LVSALSYALNAWIVRQGHSELQQRIEELACKANEGELTEAERAEYQGYVRANEFVAILQAKARKLLFDPSSTLG